MTSPERKLTNPREIGERGQHIYETKYKQDFESRYMGKFAAIEIYSEKPFVAETPEQALRQGQEAIPDGVFHLIKVGSAGAFRVSYTSNANMDWLSQ